MNSIIIGMWSAKPYATKSVHFECHMDNRVEHEGAEALPRWCWTFIHGCMLLICFVIPISSSDFYGFLYLTTALIHTMCWEFTQNGLSWHPHLNLLRARATARFFLFGWRWPVEEPTTVIYLLPLLLRLWSILLSRCGLAWTIHPHLYLPSDSRCILNISTHIPFSPLPPSFGSQLAHALCASEVTTMREPLVISIEAQM